MANYCEYEIHVKGSKKAVLMFFSTMPYMDYNDIEKEFEKEEEYIVYFRGNCKWSLSSHCKSSYDGEMIEIEALKENDIRNRTTGLDLEYYTLQVKSQLFQCEIQAHSWSGESGFETFEHYKNGEMIRFETQSFTEECELDWDLEEYPTYEEFCEDYDLDPEDLSNVEIEEIDENYCIVHIAGEEGMEISFDF